MNRFRKIIFWCHLPVGVTAGVVIFIMSFTGVLLTYEKQIIAWADKRSYRVARPSAESARLPLETLLAKVREARPDASPSTVTLRADVDAPVAVALGREGTILVNQYTGEVLGEGSKSIRNFFRVITDWHRWLGADTDNRAVAKAITGACNLGFLFIVVSGIYLWWPRKWEQVKGVIWFRRGLPGKARDFNWHNVIGVWSFIPLFIVVLSATVISYVWASNLAYRVMGESPPAPRGSAQPRQTGQTGQTGQTAQTAQAGQQGQQGQRGQRGQTTPAPAQNGGQRERESSVNFDGLDPLLSRAELQMPGWQTINLRLPTSADAPAIFTIDQGSGGQPQKRAQLTLDRKSGEVVQWEPFSSYTAGRKLRTILRFAHTGEVAGIIGQTIAGLASLGAVFLVYTGLALSWRRFRAWVARRYRRSAPIASPLGEGAE
jgi:uncharacterized iron-regulated membrane protein